ncbi:amidohydrolase family protein [Embleya sp. NPDC008237]|uniref:amidohydrolase family protein n=1 Tax=Embleya sp. NPDC008237 TaxID=3363978 RepID=UPI0036E972D1
MTVPSPTLSRPDLLHDATLPDGTRADITIRAGRIAALDPVGDRGAGDEPPVGTTIDVAGALVLPAFVDGHVHLDKTFLGSDWQPHVTGGTIRERVAAERALRERVRVPTAERAAHLVRRIVALGTGHVRSHVDVDPQLGLSGLHALVEVRERFRDVLSVQLVAFPQSGIVTAPGTADLLDAALREGADLIGGLDPIGFDNDVEGHLDVVFGLAERHGAGIDLHLHDGGESGAGQLREIAARTAAVGLAGKVTVSHAYCLGDLEPAAFARTADALADAGVSILTNGPSGSMPPVLALRDRGVRVFAGSDNIRDAWWPYGTGDMLERATIVGLRQDLMSDDELAVAADLVTDAAATALGLPDYGLTVGARADLVVVEAASLPEAVAAHPARRLVLHAGRTVAAEGRLLG